MLSVRTAFCFAIPFVVGCGAATDPNRPAVVPTSGVVLQNNQPVAGATVVFVPVDHKFGASGLTDNEGKFSLRTFAPGDGAVPGRYQVTIRKVEMVSVKPMRSTESTAGESGDEDQTQSMTIEKFITPEKYARATTSGLQEQVNDGGENSFAFNL